MESHPAYPNKPEPSNIVGVTAEKRYIGVLTDDKTFTLWNTELMLVKMITVDIKKRNQTNAVKVEAKESTEVTQAEASTK